MNRVAELVDAPDSKSNFFGSASSILALAPLPHPTSSSKVLKASDISQVCMIFDRSEGTFCKQKGL